MNYLSRSQILGNNMYSMKLHFRCTKQTVVHFIYKDMHIKEIYILNT